MKGAVPLKLAELGHKVTPQSGELVPQPLSRCPSPRLASTPSLWPLAIITAHHDELTLPNTTAHPVCLHAVEKEE